MITRLNDVTDTPPGCRNLEETVTAPRDVERVYSTADVVAKLRRLADALESETSFRIQIAGERFRVPARAQFSIEHERGDGEEEVEFQLKWKIEETDSDDDSEGTVV
ncbi:amphi-Trp domain-containing protein [Amycolatopsis thailandensis]|uniref:amphi-Trp domain-containing protein n=1 Tax=Amycolatopsis thailandensis TaxID=589330 RepID=UPI001FC9F51D|nr:amphi-Trp domain-containing protein [Amycolatopsis thailandensis]